MSARFPKRSTRTSRPDTKARVTNRLARFRDSRSRPPETLRYHELQGFLFAVASAPERVRPSEWIPEVFDGEEAGFEGLGRS